MSNDTDKDSVDSAGAHRTRRRRKKSGLRIPSDNVPRTAPVAAVADPDATTPAGEDAGIVAPVPEDPMVAVKVAYAFGGGESPGASVDEDEPAPVADEPDAVTVKTPAASAETAAQSSTPRGKASRRARTRQDDDDFDTRRTTQMPAIKLEELGLELGGTSSTSNDEDAVEIDVEDDSDKVSSGVSSGVIEVAMPRAHTVALSDEDLEELIEPVDTTQPTKPIRAAVQKSKLIKGLKPVDMDMRATQPLPILSKATDAGTSYPKTKVSGTINAVAGEVSVEAQRPAKSPLRTVIAPPEPGVPAAVAALEQAGIESPHDSPLQFGDPSDSGEILSDDLIEEVDETDVEVEQDTRKQQPPPSPTPSVTVAVPKKPPPAPKGKAPEAPMAKPKRRKGKPWFEEIFDEDYLRTLPFLTPQATQAEAAFVASALDSKPGAQILDIGCGYGRHAMELAARGFQVVALDFSLPLLLRGADEAQRRGLNINFVHGDMRELTFEDQFDGAYCLFSTFGYFEEEANKKTARGIAKALKPGARLIIEVLNRDYLIADLPARVWWEGDGCVVLEEVDFNYFSSRIASRRSVVFDDGRQLEQEISMRAYSLHEFGKLLHSAGFRVLEVSGSMATRGRFFGNQSRAIIVVAEKRSEHIREAVHGHQFPRGGTSADTTDSRS